MFYHALKYDITKTNYQIIVKLGIQLPLLGYRRNNTINTRRSLKTINLLNLSRVFELFNILFCHLKLFKVIYNCQTLLGSF